MRSACAAQQVVVVASLMFAACAPIPQREDAIKQVQSTTQTRLHQSIAWPTSAHIEPVSPTNNTLSRADALKIALRDNPDIQARCAELGIALADYQAASALPNPVLNFMLRAPDRAPRGLNFEFEVLASLLDILQRPARVRAQSLAVDAASSKVSAAILDFAGDVDAAYLNLQAALHKQASLNKLATTAHHTADAAVTLARAGGLDRLTVLHQEMLALNADARVGKAELATSAARVHFARMLGRHDGPDLPLPPPHLPELPSKPSAPTIGILLALDARLDLSAERQALTARASARQLVLDWRWWSLLHVGLSTEHDSGGQFVTGPRVEIALPIFDRKDAELVRMAAELHQAQAKLAGQVLDLQNAALLAADTVRKNHALARNYRDQLLPLQRALEATAQAQAVLGALSRVELRIQQRASARATASYIDALRDYWLAEANLRRTLGGGDVPGLVSWHAEQ